MKLICAVCFILAYSSAIAVDYCDPKLCRNPTDHIGCNNGGKIHSSCASKSQFFDLSDMKATIVDFHNTVRDQVASGKLKNLKKAARMATMEWDNELAYLAGLNVKTCKFAHDRCRNTPTFKYSGQNIATWMGFPEIEPTKAVDTFLKNWFKEYEYTMMAVIDKFKPSRNPRMQYGHFTVMVVDKNTRVGCALLKIVDGKVTKYLMACNYASTNIVGYPIYKISDTAGSECSTGLNPKYRALCSPAEKYT